MYLVSFFSSFCFSSLTAKMRSCEKEVFAVVAVSVFFFFFFVLRALKRMFKVAVTCLCKCPFLVSFFSHACFFFFFLFLLFSRCLDTLFQCGFLTVIAVIFFFSIVVEVGSSRQPAIVLFSLSRFFFFFHKYTCKESRASCILMCAYECSATTK